MCYGYSICLPQNACRYLNSDVLTLTAADQWWRLDLIMVAARWVCWEVFRSVGACPWKVVFTRKLIIISIQVWPRFSVCVCSLLHHVIVPPHSLPPVSTGARLWAPTTTLYCILQTTSWNKPFLSQEASLRIFITVTKSKPIQYISMNIH